MSSEDADLLALGTIRTRNARPLRLRREVDPRTLVEQVRVEPTHIAVIPLVRPRRHVAHHDVPWRTVRDSHVASYGVRNKSRPLNPRPELPCRAVTALWAAFTAQVIGPGSFGDGWVVAGNTTAC
eukprot:3036144-Rhodomonas_salina.1